MAGKQAGSCPDTVRNITRCLRPAFSIGELEAATGGANISALVETLFKENIGGMKEAANGKKSLALSVERI